MTVWLSWADDCLIVGPKENVLQYKNEMMGLFDYDDIGEMHAYVGCGIDRDYDKRSLKFTQPVLLQSVFGNEFELTARVHKKAPAGTTLRKGEDVDCISPERMKKYRSGVGKLLHLTKWSRPDIQNAVRELSRYMMRALNAHEVPLQRVMEYCVGTPDFGLTLQPIGQWDGQDRDHEFVVSGYSDSDYAKCPDTRKSVSGWAAFLNGAPISTKSKMQE